MNARQSQLTGRLRLRHLMERTEAVAEEMTEDRGRFERLADPSAAPRVVSAFNLFQTPEPLAARVVGMFNRIGRTLEPSAGLGRLYRALRSVAAAVDVVLVEQAAECAGELYRATESDPACTLVQGDFLECTPERLGLFDSIVMNPPFKCGTDVRHIRHALRFLAPGGRLVSICAAGPKQRAALMPLGEWHPLPAGSFKESYTSVEAAIVVIDRE